MHHSVNPSSRLGVAGALQHFFYLYVFYIRLLKCAVHGHAAFGETQWPDHKAHRLDHVAQYEIIIPQWMSPARQKRSPSSSKPPPNAEIKITAEGKELVLRLERNEQLFASEYTETWYSPSGALLSSSPQHAEHCFYHGAVRGQEGSGVALSTCRGLRGLITVNRTVSYLIEPLPNGTDADQHAVYRVESLRLQQGTCGHRHGDHADRLEDIIAGLIHTEQHGREKRDLRKNTKYVELMIVADNAEFQKHGRDLDKTRMKLLEAANYVDKFYKALNIRVALIGLEIWTDQDKISVSDNPFSTLCAFLDWRRKQLPRLKNDNAQLVTGVPFQGSTIGLAPLKAMCSEYQSGGVNSDHSHIAIGVAATMAHEMGHNFGMSHDISGCCLARPEDGGCIMASATGHPFPRLFNRCNEKELERYLGSGGGKCLFNPPNTDAMYGGRRCGNGYLEEGEECDCGEEEECSSPCCNANNCTLRAGAECAHGVCCHNCKLKSPGVLCREPSGQCDLPEYCDGTSEFCPANFYLMDGTSCEGGRAYCYTGMCLTLEQQCLLLWGPGARPAPDPCFEKVNIAGDQYGNCGKDLMGKYMRCESRHAKCGKIQCQSSAAKPLETNAVSIDTTITLNGRQFKCRGTHVYPMGQGDESVGDTLDPGLVMTGTKCGEREICFEGQCRNSSFLQADDCRAKCNGHGLCNNNHNCHCDAGWAPPFCDRKGTGGSLDSGSITTHSSLLPVLVLLPLLLAAGLAAVGLWCCYKHRLHPLKKGPAPPLEAPQTSCAPSSNGKAAANGHANPTFQLKPQDPGHLGVTPTGSPASLKQRSAITRPSVKPPPVPSSVGQQPPQQPGVSLPAPPSTVPPAISRTPPRHGPPPSRPPPPCPVPQLGQELQNTNKPQLPKAVNSAEGLKQCLKISMLPPAGQGPKVRFQDETIRKS